MHILFIRYIQKNHTHSIQSRDLHEDLFLALVGNKPEFVRLLLENGASLKELLHQDETLCELYRQLPPCLFRRKLLRSNVNISLAHVSEEVKKLLGSFTQLLYPSSDQKDSCSMSLNDPSSAVSPFIYIQDQKRDQTFDLLKCIDLLLQCVLRAIIRILMENVWKYDQC